MAKFIPKKKRFRVVLKEGSQINEMALASSSLLAALLTAILNGEDPKLVFIPSPFTVLEED